MACSYGTNFVVVNASDQIIEVQYVFKKPSDPFPPMQMPPIPPVIKTVSPLQQQITWRELSPSQYAFDSNSRRLIVSLKPGEALRVEQRNLRDEKVDATHNATNFFIEEIEVKGSYGEIRLQGEQVRQSFLAESKSQYTLTYR